MNLEKALNAAFHANAFNGLDLSVIDVDAYLEHHDLHNADGEGRMVGFDGMDVTELTSGRSCVEGAYAHVGRPIELEDDFNESFHDHLERDHDEPYIPEDEPYDDMDGDAESALASAGWGTDEDYGYYGDGE